MYETSPGSDSPLRQGEILSGLRRAKVAPDSLEDFEELTINFEEHEYAVLMTQDCDLDLDYLARHGESGVKSDKVLPDLLFCQALPADLLRGQPHIKSDIWRRIRGHNHERYQILSEIPPASDRLHRGVPSLGLDFKRLFTIPTDETYRRLELTQTQRRGYLISPYREHLVHRFTRFHGRVALPATLVRDLMGETETLRNH